MIDSFDVEDSSVVKKVMYNSADNTIVVETVSKKRYLFPDQSREEFDLFTQSPSKGKFFNEMIRKGKQ